MTCMFDHVVGKEKLHADLLLGVQGLSGVHSSSNI